MPHCFKPFNDHVSLNVVCEKLYTEESPFYNTISKPNDYVFEILKINVIVFALELVEPQTRR